VTATTWGRPGSPGESLRTLGRAVRLITVLAAGAVAAGIAVGLTRRRDRQAMATRQVAAIGRRVGPAAMKAAQILATRRDVLPGWVCDGLSELWADAPAVAAAEVRRHMNANPALAGPRRLELLGSGTIASVYAVHTEGEPTFAIKVLRPGVVDQVRRDLHVIAGMSSLLARLKAFRGIPVREMIAHVCDGVWGQVNLMTEARSLEQLQQSLIELPHVRVPIPDLRNSTAQLLIMEWVPPAGDGPATLAPSQVATETLRAIFHMLFVTGVVHVDLHPGNLSIRADEIVIFDAGFVVELPDDIRRNLASFFVGLGMHDGPRCARAIIASAQVGAGFDEPAFSGEVASLVARHSRKVSREFSLIQFAGELFDVQRRHSLFPDPSFVFPLLSLLVVEGQIKALHPDADFQKVAAPYVLNAARG
jgi:ubiquinone biosynthesis protein